MFKNVAPIPALSYCVSVWHARVSTITLELDDADDAFNEPEDLSACDKKL